MGGIITLGALRQYSWIEAAVSLMGCPCYVSFAKYLVDGLKKAGNHLLVSENDIQIQLEKLTAFDLSMKPESLNNRPLLFWHGKKDPVVPYHFAYNFYQEVKNNLYQRPEHIRFILDENADHKVTREGLLETVAWFTKYLT